MRDTTPAVSAREYDCAPCKREGKKTPAVTFVGEQSDVPMCQPHAAAWHRTVENDLLNDIGSLKMRDEDTE